MMDGSKRLLPTREDISSTQEPQNMYREELSTLGMRIRMQMDMAAANATVACAATPGNYSTNVLTSTQVENKTNPGTSAMNAPTGIPTFQRDLLPGTPPVLNPTTSASRSAYSSSRDNDVESSFWRDDDDGSDTETVLPNGKRRF